MMTFTWRTWRLDLDFRFRGDRVLPAF